MGPQHAQAGIVRANLATTLINLGDYAAAIRQGDAALEIFHVRTIHSVDVYPETGEIITNDGRWI